MPNHQHAASTIAPAFPAALLRWLGIVFLAALIGGCASVLPQVARTPSKMLKADASSALAAAAEAAALAPGMSGFHPMLQGAFALDARLALIENAKASIDLQTYLLADDPTGRLILRSLRDAAVRGVRVRLLLDDFYTLGEDPLLLGLAAYPNVEVRLFNPFVLGREGSVMRLLAFAGSFKRLNHRMHNKLLTADGVMAIAGGRNTADEYFFQSKAANFIDFDLLITGELVPHLGALFDKYWNSEQVFPLESVAKTRETPAELRRTFDLAVNGDRALVLAPLPATDLFGRTPVSRGLAAHNLQFLAASATAHADSPLKASETQAGSEEATDTVRHRAFALLAQAKSEMLILSPYFIPGDGGMDQFREMRQRGLQIRVITSALPTSDEPLVNISYEHYRVPLLSTGVRLFELSSTRLERVQSLDKVRGKSKVGLHAKMGIIDKSLVTVGSMNMDPRSANTNTELGILVHSEALANEILGQLDKLDGVYELKLKPDGKTVAWAATDKDGDQVVDEEPDSSLWQRARLFFQYLFISDDLL